MADWTNPNVQQVVPLFQGGSFNNVSNSVGTVVPGTPMNVFSLINVSSYNSYDINLYAIADSVGSVDAVMTAQIQLQWFDDLVSGIPVFEEDWFYYAGRAQLASGLNPLAGTGPMHGTYMSATVSVPATAAFDMLLQYLNIFASPRVVPYSDWRQNTQVVLPETNGLAIFPSNAIGYDNNLTNINSGALGAGSQVWCPNALYSGPAYYYIDFGSTPQNDIVLVSTEGLVAGNLVVGTSCPGMITAVPGTAGDIFNGTVFLPRAPTAWVIHGNAAASAVTIQMFAQQAA